MDIESKKSRVFRELLNWLLYLVILVIVTILINTFIGQRTHVKGASMEPHLHNGDNLIVDKITYRFRTPERYEIVVFPFRHAEDTYYIKRVIGLPGETIQIIDGYVWIDDELLGETYGREVMEHGGIASEPILLGYDEYFVLGDNRNNSSDSRDPNVGVLRRSEFLGRAWLRIWPLNDFGFIPHN